MFKSRLLQVDNLNGVVTMLLCSSTGSFSGPVNKERNFENATKLGRIWVCYYAIAYRQLILLALVWDYFIRW